MRTLSRSTRSTTQPQSRGGRPCGPQSPQIARIEGLVEAIVALQDDSRLCRRGSKALKVIADAHVANRQLFDAARISQEQFDCDEAHLDRIETRLGFALLRRSSHLEKRVIPEVQSLYRVAERVA